jgi:hypothetical protein
MSLAVFAMLILCLAREFTHHIHDTRRDKLISELTDKIKAKDFTEYVEATKPLPLFEPVSKSDEDMYWEEIQENKQ